MLVDKINILHGQDHLIKIINFLEEIGIKTIKKKLTSASFLPGLEIGPNCIFIDQEKLSNPGDLLHEAGHIAVTEAKLRPHIGDPNMHKIAGVPSWPTDGDEIAAILWSFAAAEYLKIPIDFIFHSNGYKNEADFIIAQFTAGNYIGLPYLEWMGLCDSTTFPKMTRWMRL